MNPDLDDSKLWSEDEKRLLRHEAFMAETLKRRASPEKENAKPLWQRFLETTGGTAMITVLIGGIFGQIISSSIQSNLQEREFRQAWLKARGDQALIAIKDYNEKEQAVLLQAYDLIGGCVSASEDLIDSTRVEFDEESRKGKDQQDTENLNKKIWEDFNAKDKEWRSGREKLKLLMSYYHHGQSQVIKAWNEAQTAVTGYMFCAQDFYKRHPGHMLQKDDNGLVDACKPEKENLTRNLDSLNTSLEEARKYLWEGWESPDRLREVLEQNKK